MDWVKQLRSKWKWWKLSRYLMSKKVQFNGSNLANRFIVHYKDIDIKIQRVYYHHVITIVNNGVTEDIGKYLYCDGINVYKHLEKLYAKSIDPKDDIEQLIFGGLK